MVLLLGLPLILGTAPASGLSPAEPERADGGQRPHSISQGRSPERTRERRVFVGDQSRMRPGLSAQAATATPDAFESDDGMGTARDLDAVPSYLYFGTEPYKEAHTLHAASGATGTADWDEDWFTLTVDEADIRRGYNGLGISLLIETWTRDPSVDTVIEVYREGATPTDPRSLLDEDAPGEGGYGFTDTDPEAFAANDEEFWFANSGSSVLFLLDPTQSAALAGRYYVRIRPYYQGDFPGRPDEVPIGFSDGAGAYTFRYKLGTAQRLSGANRYETAVRTSRERYPDSYCEGWWITVASGLGFADALSGSTLAGAAGGPLLLTDRTTLPAAARGEIARLAKHDPAGGNPDRPTKVFVLGGPTAVSDGVLRAIDAIPDVDVERVYGANRYATSAAVSRKAQAVLESMVPTWGVSKLAFVTSGVTFPDALAASPMATYNAAPILLTDPAGLSPDARAALIDLGITDVVIVGGTLAVSGKVETQLKTLLGSTRVKRVFGIDRYQTARRFAEWASDLYETPVGTDAPGSALLWPLYPESIGLASGKTFPDALAGGVMCGHSGYPLLLNDLGRSSSEVYRYVDSYANCIDLMLYKSYAFGGPSALPAPDFEFFDSLTLPWWTDD